MARKITRIQRLDPDFIVDLEEVSIKRIKNGKDKRPKSIARLTRGMRRHTDFRKILDDLSFANMEEDLA